MKCESYYKELVAGKRCRLPDRLTLAVLRFCAVLYAAVMRLRGMAYSCGFFPVKRLPRPVISVGNISMGGTGKTPMVLLIARELMSRGKRVAVLTRGYGGSLEGETRIVSDGVSLLLKPEEAGDEPCLLASTLPGLMVIMGTNRHNAGMLAMQKLSPDCFILDDGFQHQRLARNLDILLLDATAPFGNGRTIPAGFLREPPSAAERADLVILTRCTGEGATADFIHEGTPVCRSSHKLTGYTSLSGGELMPFEKLVGKRVVAFSGIADPAAFFDSLEASGLPLVATLAFPDHTGYGPREMEAVGRLKQNTRAHCLVTTAKDAVKLLPYSGILRDCYVARLDLQIHDPEPLMAALEKII